MSLLFAGQVKAERELTETRIRYPNRWLVVSDLRHLALRVSPSSRLEVDLSDARSTCPSGSDCAAEDLRAHERAVEAFDTHRKSAYIGLAYASFGAVLASGSLLFWRNVPSVSISIDSDSASFSWGGEW